MVEAPLVIVVEPSEGMQEILKADLEEEFLCRVEVRGSVRKLSAAVNKEKPALIVVDIETPGAQRFIMDLKDDPRTCAIPIIGANLTEQRACRQALEVGYDACFTANLRQLESLAWRYLPVRPTQQNLAR